MLREERCELLWAYVAKEKLHSTATCHSPGTKSVIWGFWSAKSQFLHWFKKSQFLLFKSQVLVAPVLYKTCFWVICLSRSSFQLPPHFSSLFIPCTHWMNYLQLLCGKQTLPLCSRQSPTLPLVLHCTDTAFNKVSNYISLVTLQNQYLFYPNWPASHFWHPSGISFFMIPYHH